MSAYRRGPGCEGCRRGVRRLIAGQAACSYSWMRPPRRSVRVSCANGGARSGIALLLDAQAGEVQATGAPMAVVVVGVGAQDMFELATAEDEQPVEALSTDAADPALGVGVRVRRLDGCADHCDPLSSEDVIEAAAELGVAIVDEEAERLPAVIERHQEVARLLGDPGACWVRGAGDEFDPAALERDEEEHVDPFQPGGLDREEIAGERRRRVLAEEVAPGELISLRRGRQPVADEDRPHRGRRNTDAKTPQLADDPSVAPTRVLASQTDNQRLDATIERRPPRPPVRIRPTPPDQLPVPAQQRRRTHRQTCPGAPR